MPKVCFCKSLMKWNLLKIDGHVNTCTNQIGWICSNNFFKELFMHVDWFSKTSLWVKVFRLLFLIPTDQRVTWLIVGQCKSDQFECQNHECVSLSKRCDWRKDCSDGSDEFRCGNVLQHKRNDCSVLFNFTAKELSVWPKFSHENFILFYS